MSFFRTLSSAALLATVAATMLFAAETDYTWSLGGEVYADRDTSYIYIGVNNTVDVQTFTVELHYDTSMVERLSEKQIGRASGISLTTNTDPNAPFRRLVLFSIQDSIIHAGSGSITDSILQVGFKVKEGVAIGSEIVMHLTTTTNRVATWDTLVVPTTFVVTGAPNAAPVFTDPGAQSATQGKRFSLLLEATDDDDDPLVYRMLTSPGTGAALDSTSGLFTWTPQESGSATAEFEVSDGQNSDTLTVMITVALGNVAPVWATSADTLDLMEGSAFTHTFSAPTDANSGDVVTVSAGTLPGTATFDSLSLTLSWTPGSDEAGNYELVLTAADQAGLKSYHNVYLIVADVNRAPELSVASSALEVEEGDAVSFTLAASDPDRDELTVSWEMSPQVSGDTLVNQVFSWREAVSGTYTVTVTVEDPSGLTATVEVTITVTSVNHPPVFRTVTDTSADVGQALQLTLAADDPDGDNLTYELVLADQTENILTRGATFSGGVFSWTPAASDAGPNLVVVRAEDPDGLGDETSFTITVNAEGVSAPVSFAAFEDLTVAEGEELSFELPLGDATAFVRDSLGFWAIDLPVGAVWSKEDGSLTWTPSLQQAGTYVIHVGVSDGNFEDDQRLTIIVEDTDVPPTLTPIGNREVDEGELLTVTLEAVDSSSLEALTFSAEGLPSGATLYNLGSISYQPGYDASGSYEVTVTTTDGNSNTDSETFTLTVNDVNRAPEITVENQTVDEGQTLGFTVETSDPDSDDVTLEVDALPPGASFEGATGTFVWTPDQNQSGNWDLVFVADDGNGGLDSALVIVTVGDVNHPPVFDRLLPVVVREGDQKIITVVAGDPDDGDVVTIASSNLPSGATLTQTGSNPATAKIRYKPGYQQQGTFNINLTATDNASEPLTARSRFRLVVKDIDVAPSFTGDLAGSGTLNLSIDEGDTLDLELTATDPGGDRVTVNARNLPRGARITQDNPKRLVYSPGYGAVNHSTGDGTSRAFYFDLVASDGRKTTLRRVKLTVNDVNRPPHIPGIEDQVVDEGKLISFQVRTIELDGDSVTVFTAGRVPYLTAGNPPPARVRDGNVFIFDTSILPQDSIIRSAVFQFWGEDAFGAVSDTVEIEIAIRRDTTVAVPDIPGGGNFSFGAPGGGFNFSFGNSGSSNINGGNFGGLSLSGLINLLFGGGNTTQLASYAGEEKAKGLYAFTYLAGDLESQFYGIRRGWQLDLSSFSAGTGADSLVPGANVAVSLVYNDEDIPTEIPNFSEDRIMVFGFDAVAQVWVPADSQSVDTTTNTATFKLTNPNLIDYTIGAVLDVVAPVITDLKVTGGNYTVNTTSVDTLYSLDGDYQFKTNVTDDEVLSSTNVTLYYSVDGGAFNSLAMDRSGVNLFTAMISEGALADGTVISYYIEAADNMNTVLRPEGAPNEVYQLVVAEYTGKPGDLDGNTTINIFDLLGLLKVISGSQPASIISDVDQNGKTDIFDLLALLKLL